MEDFCVLENIHQWLNIVENRDIKDKNNIDGQIPQSNQSFFRLRASEWKDYNA